MTQISSDDIVAALMRGARLHQPGGPMRGGDILLEGEGAAQVVPYPLAARMTGAIEELRVVDRDDTAKREWILSGEFVPCTVMLPKNIEERLRCAAGPYGLDMYIRLILTQHIWRMTRDTMPGDKPVDEIRREAAGFQRQWDEAESLAAGYRRNAQHAKTWRDETHVPRHYDEGD